MQTATNNTDTKSQFGLLTQKRFGAFFWTQLLGAFNDNLFKNALLLSMVYAVGSAPVGASNMLVNVAAGLFILPFFLFSAFAGQLADKYEKSGLIRRLKLAEIVIMVLAAVGFYLNSTTLLMAMLFCMGAQSSFFGPVKYSILPQQLTTKEIVGGNALVEMGTFVAILLGTICGGLLIQMTHGRLWTGYGVILTALVGWLASRSIPAAPPAAPDMAINWNPVNQTLRTVSAARKERPIFLAILALSWFWFLGAAYLTQLPAYTRNVLGGDESVVTLLLAMFAIGVGTGSLLCEVLSGRKVELGLVPLGALGLSLFGLYLSESGAPRENGGLLSILPFLQSTGSMRGLSALFMIGVCGGLYTVPLFAFIQIRTRPETRAQMIAANNIFNALFMVISSISGALLLGLGGMSIPHFFLVLAVANLLVTAYIFKQLPEFTVRFLAWMMIHTMYRIRKQDLEQIPEEGAAVLVSNHISYMDALIIGGACRRPIRFVMHGPYFNLPVMKHFFRAIGAIPIVSKRMDPVMYERAFDEISAALDTGELICIFPEGGLTRDGQVDHFRPGIEKIIQRNPVPVVPLALRGLWGSFFSHRYGKALLHLPRRFRSRIELVAGRPVSPGEISANHLQDYVRRLRGSWA